MTVRIVHIDAKVVSEILHITFPALQILGSMPKVYVGNCPEGAKKHRYLLTFYKDGTKTGYILEYDGENRFTVNKKGDELIIARGDSLPNVFEALARQKVDPLPPRVLLSKKRNGER